EGRREVEGGQVRAPGRAPRLLDDLDHAGARADLVDPGAANRARDVDEPGRAVVRRGDGDGLGRRGPAGRRGRLAPTPSAADPPREEGEREGDDDVRPP